MMHRQIFDLGTERAHKIEQLGDGETVPTNGALGGIFVSANVNATQSSDYLELKCSFATGAVGSLVVGLPPEAFRSNRYIGIHLVASATSKTIIVPKIYAAEDGEVVAAVSMRGMVVDNKPWSFSEAAHFHRTFDEATQYYLDLSIRGEETVLRVERLMAW